MEGMYFIQVGAFKNQQNASQLSVKLGKISACQVVVILENGFYKVRLGGFSSKSALNACKEVIITLGLFTAEQINVISPTKKVKRPKPIPVTKSADSISTIKKPVAPIKVTLSPDTVKKVATKTITIQVSEAKTPVNQPTGKISKGKKLYFVQMGAFTDQRNAARIVINSTHTIPYKLEIIHNDQLYKVRFGVFNTRKEAEECIKLIDEKGRVSKESLIIVSEEVIIKK